MASSIEESEGIFVTHLIPSHFSLYAIQLINVDDRWHRSTPAPQFFVVISVHWLNPFYIEISTEIREITKLIKVEQPTAGNPV